MTNYVVEPSTQLRYEAFAPQPDGVRIMSLVDPPGQEDVEAGMVKVMNGMAQREPLSLEPVWGVTDHGVKKDEIFVPMNHAARAAYYVSGYMGTSGINGCFAVAAALRGQHNRVETFLEHYDWASAGQAENGTQKMYHQLASFVGGRAVRAAIAYPREAADAWPFGDVAYETWERPDLSLIQACASLPAGSEVTLIPYAKARGSDLGRGNVLCVGRGGADGISFRWNEYDLQVGEAEEFDAARLAHAKDIGGMIGQGLETGDPEDFFLEI